MFQRRFLCWSCVSWEFLVFSWFLTSDGLCYFYIVWSGGFKSPVWRLQTGYLFLTIFSYFFKGRRFQGYVTLRRCDLHGSPSGDVWDRRDDALLLHWSSTSSFGSVRTPFHGKYFNEFPSSRVLYFVMFDVGFTRNISTEWVYRVGFFMMILNRLYLGGVMRS